MIDGISMPQTQTLVIRLRGPVSFSAKGASTGGHATLTHIPGAALRGLCAKSLYCSASPKERWLIFHSGAIRFGDGWPSPDGKSVAWPTPRALHGLKDAKGATRENLAYAGRAHATAAIEGVAQFEAERRGHVVLDEDTLHPFVTARRNALKTALAPGRGVAEKGRLFDQEAIEEGQLFIAVLEADAEAASLLGACVDAITGARRLGRSRGAEYGAVEISKLASIQWPNTTPAIEGLSRVWTLSDVCVDGDPLERFAGAFGFTLADIDMSRTFVATRAFAPFNGHFKEHEAERRLIVSGSVVTFRRSLPSGVRTVGVDQALGFGRVAVNPAVLSLPQVAFARKEKTQIQALSVAMPDTPLGSWLRMRRADICIADALDAGTKQIEALQSALPPASPGRAPSRTQWRNVLEAALAASSLDGLARALFDGAQPLIDGNRSDWKTQTSTADKQTYFVRLKRAIDVARNLERPAGLSEGGVELYRVRAFARAVRTYLAGLARAREDRSA